MASDLFIIHGGPGTGKSSVAVELARSFLTKTAVVSFDHLSRGAIAVPDLDLDAEKEMARTQLKLLVANYMRNGYNVVAEGDLEESVVDSLVALMRNLTRRAVVVRLLTHGEPAIEPRLRTGSLRLGLPGLDAPAAEVAAAIRAATK